MKLLFSIKKNYCKRIHIFHYYTLGLSSKFKLSFCWNITRTCIHSTFCYRSVSFEMKRLCLKFSVHLKFLGKVFLNSVLIYKHFHDSKYFPGLHGTKHIRVGLFFFDSFIRMYNTDMSAAVQATAYTFKCSRVASRRGGQNSAWAGWKSAGSVS